MQVVQKPLVQDHAASPVEQSPISQKDVKVRHSMSPTTVLQAPSGVVPPNPELHYAPPYIPPPNIPPPEDPDHAMPPPWRPVHSRALLVGCNYMKHPDIMLRGCVNDINCIKHMLITRFGYGLDCIVILQDQQPYPEYLPTKENILAAIDWLLGPSEERDSSDPVCLFFAFSGHGLRQSSSGAIVGAVDSVDGPGAGSRPEAGFGDWEETILPCDYDSAGPITATELYEALVAPLTKNMRLHCCMDACQSGFSLDLPCHAYIRADGWGAWEKGKPRPPAPLREPSRINRLPRRYGSVFKGTGGGEAILFGTSPDDDYDNIQSQADGSNLKLHASTGAIAFALIQAVEQGQATTYSEGTTCNAVRGEEWAHSSQQTARDDFL
eukprot:jgi/Botrbrau1/23215/Bobra.0041s0059.1